LLLSAAETFGQSPNCSFEIRHHHENFLQLLTQKCQRLRQRITPESPSFNIYRTRTNWADEEEDEVPPSQITTDPHTGIKTIITYRLDAQTGQKLRATRRIKTVLKKEHVPPAIAARKAWPKFGAERGNKPGPDLKTTQVGEDIPLKLAYGWKNAEKAQQEEQKATMSLKPENKKVACRICKGEHFTAKCPYKDTLQPMDEFPTLGGDSGPGTPGRDSPDIDASNPNPGSGGRTSYVPPHLRAGANRLATSGSSMSHRERDDTNTLRVTNLSEDVTDDDLRDLFGRFGRISRVFLAKDRETNRTKGFAFVSFHERADAEKAMERLDKKGYDNLIIRVEFAGKRE
jgi:translation initiation factor 3 subunit G